MTEKEERVALLIHEYGINNNPIYFSKVVSTLEDEMTKSEISKIIDKMFDLCIIDAEWENHKGWVRVLKISGSYKKYFDELWLNR